MTIENKHALQDFIIVSIECAFCGNSPHRPDRTVETFARQLDRDGWKVLESEGVRGAACPGCVMGIEGERKQD